MAISLKSILTSFENLDDELMDNEELFHMLKIFINNFNVEKAKKLGCLLTVYNIFQFYSLSKRFKRRVSQDISCRFKYLY